MPFCWHSCSLLFCLRLFSFSLLFLWDHVMLCFIFFSSSKTHIDVGLCHHEEALCSLVICADELGVAKLPCSTVNSQARSFLSLSTRMHGDAWGCMVISY